MEPYNVVHIIATLSIIAYLTFASGFIYPLSIANDGQQRISEAVLHVRRTTAMLFWVWAFTFIIYVPLMLLDLSKDTYDFFFAIAWYVVVIVGLPASMQLLENLMKDRSRCHQWLPWVIVPEVSCFVWYVISPSTLPFYCGVGLMFALVVGMDIYLYRRFKDYSRQLLEENGDVSRSQLRRVSFVFAATVLQGVMCVACLAFKSLILSYINILAAFFCAYYILRCVSRFPLIAINTPVVESVEAQPFGTTAQPFGTTVSCPTEESLLVSSERVHAAETTDSIERTSGSEGAATNPDESANAEAATDSEDLPAGTSDAKLHALIRQKLKVMCEDKKLYLDPELTREGLSAAIKVNRTYLSRYFHEVGTTYYQYINNLRVEYAAQLIKADPTLSLIEVCMRSGFSNSSTFRRSFREVKGCLPSEYGTN